MRFKLSCPECEHPIGLIVTQDLSEVDVKIDEIEKAQKIEPKPKSKSPSTRGPIGIFADDPEIADRLKETLQSIQDRWVKLYGNPLWIKQEILKALNWMESKKVFRKDFGKFISNWLATAAKDRPEFKPQPKGLSLEA